VNIAANAKRNRFHAAIDLKDVASSGWLLLKFAQTFFCNAVCVFWDELLVLVLISATS